jgi:hypothetical protein
MGADVNRKQRRAKRAKDRRETKPKALRRAAEARHAAELARVGGEYDPERAKAAMVEDMRALRLAAQANGSVVIYDPEEALREFREPLETLRTQVGRHVLYTRDDYTLTVEGQR